MVHIRSVLDRRPQDVHIATLSGDVHHRFPILSPAPKLTSAPAANRALAVATRPNKVDCCEKRRDSLIDNRANVSTLEQLRRLRFPLAGSNMQRNVVLWVLGRDRCSILQQVVHYISMAAPNSLIFRLCRASPIFWPLLRSASERVLCCSAPRQALVEPSATLLTA